MDPIPPATPQTRALWRSRTVASLDCDASGPLTAPIPPAAFTGAAPQPARFTTTVPPRTANTVSMCTTKVLMGEEQKGCQQGCPASRSSHLQAGRGTAARQTRVSE